MASLPGSAFAVSGMVKEARVFKIFKLCYQSVKILRGAGHIDNHADRCYIKAPVTGKGSKVIFPVFITVVGIPRVIVFFIVSKFPPCPLIFRTVLFESLV
jgi:hypothetical protein